MKLLITLLMFSFTSFSLFALDMEGAFQTFARPIDVKISFEESEFEARPWIKEFRYVVIVNKATSGKEAQSIKVYEYGQLIIKGKVSTGRDQFEEAGTHHSKHDSWTVTPTGFYTPTYLSKNHRSSSYGGRFSWLVGGTKMPYAIFFNDGIALHQAPKGTESQLGSKASGGCVRLSKDIAPDLFNRINETEGSRIPKFSVDGTVQLSSDKEDSYVYKKGFSALIIVQSKIIE
ncbi:MAG: L,D-transpeptidase [Bacteriovorax sp.]|jgi:hypothetical protein|nr:L,D-transpeptidase [Bacteriovorax sp.]